VQLISKLIKHHRGDVRSDGHLFWQYKGKHEVWLNPEKFERRKEMSKISLKNWCRANPEIISARNKMYRNPIECAKRSKEWRSKNPQRCLQLKQAWRDRNREIVRMQNNAYWKKHPEKRAEVRNKRRSKEHGANCGDRKLIKEFYRMAQRVTRCTGLKFEVDHIVSLHSGGVHDVSNLQLLPMILNRRKGKKSYFNNSIYAASQIQTYHA
jgi:hypothetical protein